MKGEAADDSEPESTPVPSEATSGATVTEDKEDGVTASKGPNSRLTRPRMSSTRLALVIGLTLVVSLAALCGLLGYRTYQQRQAEQFRQLLIQTGRQGAVNLTTIDFEHADADVKRILDSATGQFYDEFNTRSAPFIEVVKKAQSKTVGTVTEAGIESVNGDEGQVLVAVSVQTTNRGAPDEKPRYWRMRMTVARQGDDAKVSKVDFVP